MASSFNQMEQDGGGGQALDSDFDFRPREGENEDDLYNDIDEDDIRKMAEALAPQISELEDILTDISSAEDDASSNNNNLLNRVKSGNRSMREEDDEDLDEEINQLAISEQALREELEFAHDINALLTPSKADHQENPDATQTSSSISPIPTVDSPALVTPIKRADSRDFESEESRKAPAIYTLQDHSDHLKLRTEKTGGWYFCDMSEFAQSEGEEICADLVKEYALPIPFRKLKKLYSGIAHHHTPTMKSAKELSTPAKMFVSPPPKKQNFIQRTPVNAHTMIEGVTPRTPSTPLPPPSPPPIPQEEALPVRTLAIRIRPDVLVGAVMDAIHHAFEILPDNCISHVLKRQGGHFRAGVYIMDKSLAYVMDAQLCTQKIDLERRLILRFYHVQDDPEAMQELGQALQNKKMEPDTTASGLMSFNVSDEIAILANRRIKQCCSLIQRLMAAQKQGGTGNINSNLQMSWLGLKGNTFDTEKELKQAVGVHLETNFKSCPSVREENKKANPTIRKLTLPSLSDKDWPLMEVSWSLTASILDELDTRDCSYNTIATLPFGQFPALNSLDIHYCSQLRHLCRESMINDLLRAAKDLEDYSKGAEYNCAVCITLLQPMLKRYGVPPLDLPKMSKSLQEYPLNYVAPQVACPPWGTLVCEADNKIQSKTPTQDIDAETAVRMTFEAFTRQDDEEQAARLGRKNAQIMDRLATMQTHQRLLVQSIRDAHVANERASREAEIFLKHAQKAMNAQGAGYPRVLQPEVPLLIFRISQGASSSGTCYLSATQMLFVYTAVPLVGATRTTLYDLDQITFQVDESVPPSLLNPFPNTMNIMLARSRDVLFRFRPTISPKRLHLFLKVIQGFTDEERPEEFSNVVGGMDAAQHDGEIRLIEGDDDGQLSV